MLKISTQLSTFINKKLYANNHIALWRLMSFQSGKSHDSSQQASDAKVNKSANEGKHIDITDGSYRDNVLSKATVTEVYSLSPSVKGFNLQIEDDNFIFKAGQWVDVFIPGLDEVGGFSICCAPNHLKETKSISLAIKKSSWLPSDWFHKKCNVGSEISVRVGGDFYFPEGTESTDLVLVAGGVGVNPIFSILSHYYHLKSTQKSKSIGRLCFLFSAKSDEELLFKNDIDTMAEKLGSDVTVQYFTTRKESYKKNVKNFRISHEIIRQSLSQVGNKIKVYICGPPSMIETTEQYFLDSGVSKTNIYYEKWW